MKEEIVTILGSLISQTNLFLQRKPFFFEEKHSVTWFIRKGCKVENQKFRGKSLQFSRAYFLNFIAKEVFLLVLFGYNQKYFYFSDNFFRSRSSHPNLTEFLVPSKSFWFFPEISHNFYFKIIIKNINESGLTV